MAEHPDETGNGEDTETHRGEGAAETEAETGVTRL